MKLKPEGTWKNSDGSIKITIISTPGKSDEYSLEYSIGQKVLIDQIHLSNTNDEIWHILGNDILGTGILKFLSDKEILVKTSKISEIKFKRD